MERKGTMTLEQFLMQYSQGYDHDGAYGEQCVDWFRGYCRFVLEIPQPQGVVGAYQFWDNRNSDASLKNNFIPIANTPSAIPQYGDVIIWKKTLNGNFGHVAICVDKSATVNKFVSSDQNWDGKSNASNKASTKPQLITHNYNHVAGFLRPKDQSKIIKQQQKEDNMNELLQYLDVKNLDEAKAKLKEHLGEMNGKCGWGSDRNMGYLGSERDNNQRLNLEVSKLNHEILKVTTENNQFNNANIDLQVKLTTLKQEHERLQLSYADLIRSIEENSNEYIKLKLAYEKLAQELEECQNIGNNESELKAKYDTLNKKCEHLKSRILELENIIKENCNFMSQAKCKLEKLKQAVIDFINEIIDNIKKSDR